MKRSRNGLVTGAVLVCLLIVLSMTGTMVHSSMQSRRETRTRHQLEQTRWLLDAGIQRARQSLAKDSAYDGEVWEPEHEVGAFHSPRVEIVVTRSENQPARIQVIATVADAQATDRLAPFITRKSFQWNSSPQVKEDSES